MKQSFNHLTFINNLLTRNIHVLEGTKQFWAFGSGFMTNCRVFKNITKKYERWLKAKIMKYRLLRPLMHNSLLIPITCNKTNNTDKDVCKTCRWNTSLLSSNNLTS